ncbi:hypothetical protein ISN44_As02g009200 [Arabidopsis suecica]|uniref:Uncharacterized protein n=2 Tax=Arabidopsis TaxID=3701 RepID=F4IIE7_ARATH|nr:uncharacterized protein AT2G15327 [Arabidopsis thaliana]AEC06389.1 hypothetical protein AT2G15327 [Arabidopsis thaliana]KAG7640882.1 hypothetical protein ISN44_As02g009200 [Arabidopsis suecica]|eukprot:NP_671852.2 hypothetical protein AT2G15327 [Arabidopsis thaliana]
MESLSHSKTSPSWAASDVSIFRQLCPRWSPTCWNHQICLSFLRVGLLWRLRRSFTEMGFFRCLSFSRSRGGASPEIPQLVSSSWDPPLIPKELSPFMGNATPSIFLFWLFKNSNALDSSRVW